MEPTSAPPTKPPGMPDGLWNLISQYYYEMTPEDINATNTATVNATLQQALEEQQYQRDYLALKQQELAFNQQQMAQMQKEFEFQSGPYWDFFSGDYFEFQKQIEANRVTMSNDDVARSKNATLSTMYQTEAAKAQAEAAKLGAMAQMGLVRIPRQSSTAQMAY